MNGQNDFLFLVDGELSFLMRSLKDFLDASGFTTDKCDVSVKELKNLPEYPEIFIADAAILYAHSDVRSFVYDRCIEYNRKVVLIGNHIDLEKIYSVTSTNVIAQSFERPVNNNEVVEKLSAIIHEVKSKGDMRRILVVDDSPVFLRLISEWLENSYNVNVCPSATAAFHMISANKPDLILLDYEMPICNGGQFLQMLHGEPSTADIPVMFLTSKDDKETVKSLIALKPQGYLLKTQTKEQTLKFIADFFLRETEK